MIAATLWKVPVRPQTVDLWTELAEVISATKPDREEMLWVADSKVIYSSARGLYELERSLLHLLSLTGLRPETSAALWQNLDSRSQGDEHGGLVARHDPWFCGHGCRLPVAIPGLDDRLRQHLAEVFQSQQIELKAISARIVVPQQFNELVDEQGSKGRVLSQLTLELVDDLWPRRFDEPTLVLADRPGRHLLHLHGGVGRTVALLTDAPGVHFLRHMAKRRDLAYRIDRLALGG